MSGTNDTPLNGDGYSINIKRTFIDVDTNYVVLEILNSDGKNVGFTCPISTIRQMFDKSTFIPNS